MKDETGTTSPSAATLHAALLEYYSAPGKYQLSLRQPATLFASIRDILQVAAGRGSQPAADAARLREAAMFFIRAALLYPGADHYAVMGYSGGGEPSDLKERYRLLMRLIHPDFAQEGAAAWPADAAVRVNRAYEVLSSPTLRREYEEQLAALRKPQWAAGSPRPASHMPAVVPRRPHEPRLQVGKRAAWALGITLGGIAVLMLMPRQEPEHLVQRKQPASAPARQATAPLPPAPPVRATEATPAAPEQASALALLETERPRPPVPPAAAPQAAAPASSPVAAPPVAAASPPVATPPAAAASPPVAAASRGMKAPAPATGVSASPPLSPPPSRPQRPREAARPVAAPTSLPPALERPAAPVPPPLPALLPAPVIIAAGAPMVSPVTVEPIASTPAAPPAVAAAASAVAVARPAVVAASVPASPTLGEAQPLLTQVLQMLETGSGDQLLRLLDKDARQAPGAQALSRNYEMLIKGARPVRLTQVEFKGEPRDGILLVTGRLRVHAGETTIGSHGQHFMVRAEFASRGGKVMLMNLSGAPD